MRQQAGGIMPVVVTGAALVLFAAFHFLPVQKTSNEPGWGIWRAIYEVLSPPQQLGAIDGIGLASFLMFSLLIVTSPFLMPVWRKSKLALVLACLSSGLGTGGFWMMILVQANVADLASGIWCLMAAPPVNLAGLLLVRPETQPPDLA